VHPVASPALLGLEPQVAAAFVAVVGTGTLAVLAFTSRVILRLIQRKAEAVRSWAERVDTATAKVETIAPHFESNAGKSMIDRVAATQHEVELNRIQMAVQVADLREVCESLETHRGEVRTALASVNGSISNVHRRIDALLTRIPLDDPGPDSE
jgi:predicted LPLAT superfamily acyltransferase